MPLNCEYFSFESPGPNIVCLFSKAGKSTAVIIVAESVVGIASDPKLV